MSANKCLGLRLLFRTPEGILVRAALRRILRLYTPDWTGLHFVRLRRLYFCFRQRLISQVVNQRKLTTLPPKIHPVINPTNKSPFILFGSVTSNLRRPSWPSLSRFPFRAGRSASANRPTSPS